MPSVAARRTIGAVSLAVSLLVWSASVRAGDSAAAEALFTKGLSDMEAGQFDSACPAIAESQKLDPRPGTLFTLAECESRWGKIASAVAHYDDYLQKFSRMSADEQKKQRGRDKVATRARAALIDKVPKLTLVLPKEVPSSAVVERDGTPLGRAAIGVALPTDPGEHVITLRLADGSSSEQRVTLALGESKQIVIELPVAGNPTESGVDVATEETTAPEPAHDTGTKGSKKTLAFVVGGIGLAGIVVGSVTGAMVLGKKKTIKDHCTDHVCDQEGKDAADSAKTLGLMSTIGFGVGLAGITTGVILFATDSTPSRSAFVGYRGQF